VKASQIVALDDFALQAARALSASQPRCDNTIPQLPTTTPVLTDIAVISRPQAIPGGGFDYGVSLAQLQALIGGGGGIPNITFNTNFAPLTIYNYGNSVVTSSASAATNTAALTNMFATMASASGLGGGLVWIPQYNFPVNATGVEVLGPGGNPGGIVIQGLGGGGQSGGNKAFNFSINDYASAPGTFLVISGAHTSGGTWLKNLAFQWLSPGYTTDTCINVNNWNFDAEGCTFTDCPVALNMQGLASRLTHCTIEYGVNVNTPVNCPAIWLQGIQNQIIGPSAFGGGTPTGTTDTCISIGGGTANCDHNIIRGVHMVGWNYGIDYSDINSTGIGSGTQNNLIEGCHFEVNATAINMVPYSSSGKIFNETIANCVIEKGHNSQTGQPIVYIDSNTGSATNIGPIFLVNNVIYSNVTGGSGQTPPGQYTGIAQSGQYGVQIGTAAYVSILGGQISQCGTNAGSDGTANVCISGSPTFVLLDGVNLNPTYVGVNAGNSTGSTGSAGSEYGLLISGTPTNVKVIGCDFGVSGVSITGAPNTITIESCDNLGAVTIGGSVVKLLITNCTNYNYNNTVINTLANITTATAYSAATQGANSGTSYYGPSFVMFTANSSGGTFQYNGGTAQTLVASQVVCLTLASPYDTIQFNAHAPAAIMWVGK